MARIKLFINSALKSRTCKGYSRHAALLLVWTLFTIPLLYSEAQGQGIFRASAVKIHITPEESLTLLGYFPRESTGVNDSIFHRIVVLDDGQRRYYLVSSDLCYISPLEYEHMAALLAAEFGIQPDQFWWTTTHTHSAPQVGDNLIMGLFKPAHFASTKNTAYTGWVESRMVEGIRRAEARLMPAKIGAVWGYSQGNINRRAQDVDGRVILGRDPEKIADKRIGILRIESVDGDLIALLANYPVHGTVMGAGNLEISGDVQGIVSAYVESRLGAPVLLINGAAGNLAPLYGAQEAPKTHKLLHYRSLLGERIIAASERVTELTADVKLEVTSKWFKVPAREGLHWPESYAKYHGGSENMEWVNLPVSFLQINEEVAVWAAPLELFCEVAIGVRNQSPFPYTFYYGYTNGYLGYLPTEEEWPAGGYEVKVCPFYPQASEDLRRMVVAVFQESISRK